MEDYYHILQVDRQASDLIIEKAYRALAQKNHPDVHGENKEYWRRRMQKINEAYAVLKDPRQRNLYDLSLESSFDLWLRKGLIGLYKRWLSRNLST